MLTDAYSQLIGSMVLFCFGMGLTFGGILYRLDRRLHAHTHQR